MRGPPKKLTQKDELFLAKYVNERNRMGIPISVPTFKRHLLKYIVKKKLRSPFSQGEIGEFHLSRMFKLNISFLK